MSAATRVALGRRPAVVADVGGNTEWIEESEWGFVAEAATKRSFGAALERAWRERANWEALGPHARETAARRGDPVPEETRLDLLTKVAEAARSGFREGSP